MPFLENANIATLQLLILKYCSILEGLLKII